MTLLRMLRAALIAALALSPPLSAQDVVFEPAFPGLTFDSPVDLQAPPDGSARVFVVGQKGLVWSVDEAAAASKTVFLDIRDRVASGGELGLLGLAFHPDYAQNGHFYVNYTAPNPLRTVVARFTVTADPDAADPGSELVLLEVGQPFSNHNGGQLQFGPDGYLYVALGDGGSGGDPLGNGQDPRTLLGSLLRLDVDQPSGGLNYGIPPDNPFAMTDGPERDEIYAYGLRNPFRFSFGGGQLWIADVGQGAREEIDWGANGANYGWNTLEGSLCFDPPSGCSSAGTVLPILEYPHGASTGFSITGGYVATGTGCEALDGRYVYGDFVTGNVWALAFDGNGATSNTLLQDTPFLISTFGLGSAGALYVATYGASGTFQRITCSAPGAVEATVEPLRPNVTIPPGGGRFAFASSVTNGTAQTQTLDVWYVLTLPGGGERTLGTATALALAPGETAASTQLQRIPGSAPSGAYTLSVRVGTFPDEVVAADSFAFAKAAGAAARDDETTWDREVLAPKAAAGAPAVRGVYPNPLDATTTLAFTVAEASDVRLEVLDGTGRRVALLVDGTLDAGAHRATWDARAVASGVYVYRLRIGTQLESGRLTVLR